MFRHYLEDMRCACAKTRGRATLLAASPDEEKLLVGFSNIRSVFRDCSNPDRFKIASRPFIVGFVGSEKSPIPSRIAILAPQRMFAHPNSDGTLVCIGEQLPPILPADTLLLHVYRILTYAKFNVVSAVDPEVIEFIASQPPETFPTDRAPLF
jgi:hypothetical protein